MRSITINLSQNTGTQARGALQTISAQVADLADLTQQVDGKMNLTKVSPGNLTCKVLDPTGGIWTFIQTQLFLSTANAPWTANTQFAAETTVINNGSIYQCVTPGQSGPFGGPTGKGTAIADGEVVWSYVSTPSLLPPWLELYVGGVRKFMGTVDPSKLVNRKSATDYSIQVAAVDWSMQLADSYLGSPIALPWQPTTQYPVGSQVLNGNQLYQSVSAPIWTGSASYAQNAVVTNGGNTYQCLQAGISASTGGPSGTGNSISDGTVVWQYIAVPTSGNGGGPTSALPAQDGSVTWQYLPPSWQRPVPSIASNATATTAIGYSQPGANNQFTLFFNGTTRNIFFSDPCAWMHQQAVLKFASAPVLGINGTLLPGPSPYFPEGMLLRDSQGTLHQVSQDGQSWVTPPYDTTPPSGYFVVLSTQDNQYPYPASRTAPAGSFMVCLMGANPWPIILPGYGTGDDTLAYLGIGAEFSAEFSLEDPTAQDLDYWIVQAVPNAHMLVLNSVSGIVIGDKLGEVDSDSSSSWTVASVDSILSAITTVEEISGVQIGDHVYWTSESNSEMVMEDPRSILIQAVQPYDVDLSKFVVPATQDPVFSFLPLRDLAGTNLFPVSDLEPTLDGVLLRSGGNWRDPASGNPMPTYFWTGSPDAGWTGPVSAAPAAPNADWTSQVLAAPPSLMPYEVAALNPWQRLRNRAYSDVQYRQEDNGILWVNEMLVNGAFVQTVVISGVLTYQYTQNGTTYNSTDSNDNFGIWNACGANAAGELVVYDYLQMRRIVFNGNSLQVAAWSGSAWGSPTNHSWPGGSLIQSAVPMIGFPGLILAYAESGTFGTKFNGSMWPSFNGPYYDRLELWDLNSGGVLGSISLPGSFLGSTLVTTPYGVYLVGAQAIAKIVYTPGATQPLTFISLYMVNVVSTLFANSLAARTEDELVVFGRFDGASGTTTLLFRLDANLQNSSALNGSVLWSEEISTGAPTTIGAMRDPTKPGRVIGHLGGSLFQVDTVQAFCLSRFKPSGMTAMELIEHVCQLFNALAIPDANGVLHIVSRVLDDDPINLTVDRIQVDQTAGWTDFASIVRVTSQDSSYYYDAYGQQGGKLLEISEHPLCATLSACAGMAESFVAWFGLQRTENDEQWFWRDADTVPPWETVLLFSKVTVNGGPYVRLMFLSQNFPKGTAKVKTLSA